MLVFFYETRWTPSYIELLYDEHAFSYTYFKYLITRFFKK